MAIDGDKIDHFKTDVAIIIAIWPAMPAGLMTWTRLAKAALPLYQMQIEFANSVWLWHNFRILYTPYSFSVRISIKIRARVRDLG